MNKCNNNNNNNNNKIIIIMIIITNTQKKMFAGRCSRKKNVCTDNSTEKIVCLEKIFISPLQKNNGPSLSKRALYKDIKGSKRFSCHFRRGFAKRIGKKARTRFRLKQNLYNFSKT